MKAKPASKHLPTFLLGLLAAISLAAVFALAGCSSGGTSETASDSADTAATDDGSYTLPRRLTSRRSRTWSTARPKASRST